MPELKESDDFLDPALFIPVKGKDYRIEALSAENVIMLRKATAAYEAAKGEGKTLADMQDMKVEGIPEDETREDTERRIIGPAYDEMVEDGVSDVVRFRITQIIMLWTFQGFEAANAYMVTSGKGIALPNRAQRRTETRTRTAAANTTRNGKSASGTSTPKATATKAKAGVGASTSDTGKP